MSSVLKSKIVAVVLAFAVATPLTVTSAVLFAPPAEAGVLSSIKGAAKKVGGAVKRTAKGFGEVAKVGGGIVKTSAKGVGVLVKDGAHKVGSTVANGGSKVVHKIGQAGGAVVGGATKAGRAIGKRL